MPGRLLSHVSKGARRGAPEAMLLGQFSGFAKLIESHLRNYLLGFGVRAGSRFGLHLGRWPSLSRSLRRLGREADESAPGAQIPQSLAY
jgi:hypothetical protein